MENRSGKVKATLVLCVIGFMITFAAVLMNTYLAFTAKTDIVMIRSLVFIAINTVGCTSFAFNFWHFSGRPSITQIISKIPIKVVR